MCLGLACILYLADTRLSFSHLPTGEPGNEATFVLSKRDPFIKLLTFMCTVLFIYPVVYIKALSQVS